MNNIPILDLKPQYEQIKEEVAAAIEEVLTSGQFIMGPAVKEFEGEAASYLGVKHAISVNSGTDALVIGLRAAGIGPGDEVITTPFSFFATAESISNVGAIPVFVDIDPRTYNIDPDLIKAKLTERTRAILPVHLYGRPAAMTAILDIAREYNLKIIEDCAQSFGAKYYQDCTECESLCRKESHGAIEEKFTGTIGDVGAYSFFPSKNLGAYGDGGLIVTDNDDIAQSAQMLRVHGAKKKYYNEVLGYNSRLDTLQAAILQVKLKYLDGWNRGRRRVARTYNKLLTRTPKIITPQLNAGHVFHQYTIRITEGYRDTIVEGLKSQGITTVIYYPVPQDRLPVYQGKYPENPLSDLLSGEVLSLPIWPEMSGDTIELVVEAIKKTLI